MKTGGKKSLVVSLLTVAAVVSALVGGCSKKQEPTVSSNPQPAAAPEAPAQQDAAAQPAPGPVLDSSQFTGDPKQAMADADAAFRQKEYEKAVRTMLALQQAQLNAQQAQAAQQQMIALQRNLANAVASGDPNAAAAAQMLRAAHSH